MEERERERERERDEKKRMGGKRTGWHPTPPSLLHKNKIYIYISDLNNL